MKVFITYSSKDGPLAAKIVASLEAAGLDAWYDKREIMPGDNWAEKIAIGLKESDAMLVLVTPNALDSDAVHSNISYALSEKAYNKRLIPVLVGDVDDFPSSRVPWIFSHLKTVKLAEHGRNDEQFKEIVQVLKDVA